MRECGYSLNEISQKLKVSQSSVSLWTRSIVLSRSAKARLVQRGVEGRLKSAEILRQRRIEREIFAAKNARTLFYSKNSSISLYYLLLSMIYECEGGKGKFSSVEFTNSDPLLVEIFLKLLRTIFIVDESKFRIIMHLHSYHDEHVEQKFWSQITGIPRSQFHRSYKKNESGQTMKSGYRGCVQIKYFDVNIKRILLSGKDLLREKLGL